MLNNGQHENTVANSIEGVRKGTIAVLESLAEKARDFELPEPPPALNEYHLRLMENTYNVLVVGEVKRGKSSLVNALIGREILPTDVDIATCEVFRVSRVEQEGYRIRFEDNSAQEIDPTELKKYGSQGVRDIGGVPSLRQIPRWIEVDLPAAKFLPKGVNILDTPGLGSLYAAHAQITQRFVPQADAVIFVLDSEKPIILAELEFIEQILAVTSNIFFVLTKIDQYDDEQWQEIQQRDLAILKERFKGRLKDIQIWPISSTNLLLAAQTGENAFLEVSYYKQMAAALQAFLFKVAGWDRCTDALRVADHYQTVSRQTLAGRLAALEAESKEKLAELQEAAARRKRQFDAEWGPRGKKTRELIASIQKLASTHRQSFVELLNIGGTLETTYRGKIDAVKSLREANDLVAATDGQVVAEVMNKWRSITGDARLKCSALLAPFIEAADALMLPDSHEAELGIQVGAVSEIKSDLGEKLGKLEAEFLKGSKVTASVVGVVITVFHATLISLLPIAAPVVLAAGIFGAIRVWRSSGKEELKKAQQELNDHLSALLEDIRERFLHVDPVYGDKSLVNHYFDALVNAMKEQVEALAEAKLREAEAENARLNGQMVLDDPQRKARARQVQQQLTEWDALGQAIEAVVADLKILDQSLQMSHTHLSY